MAQTVQLALLPCLQIGPSWMCYVLCQNRCKVVVSLEVFPHRSDKQHTVPAPIFLQCQAHPSVPRETVKFKICKQCKTQFDGCWKDTKRVREASRGPNKDYHLLSLITMQEFIWIVRSWEFGNLSGRFIELYWEDGGQRDCSESERLIVPAVWVWRVRALRHGSLTLFIGLCVGVCVSRTKGGEVADRSSDVSFTF